ncbi:uncharacterized protein TNCV_1458301 [Trichonephila clavipes]|nr:uncharacterized protein TNCV_1458301 [Trichonephila clavipes]
MRNSTVNPAVWEDAFLWKSSSPLTLTFGGISGKHLVVYQFALADFCPSNLMILTFAILLKKTAYITVFPARCLFTIVGVGSSSKTHILLYRCVGTSKNDGDRFNSCQVIYSQFGLAIHQNDHQARRRFVEWAQNEMAVVPDFHKRILFSYEAHFWLNGYVNKQNCRIWSEANPQVYVETPLHPEKLRCALWAGGILLQKQ